MFHFKMIGTLFIATSFLFGLSAYAETPNYVGSPNLTPTKTLKVKPYRTFLHIQRYTIESNGEPDNPISNVRLELEFPPKKATIHLPGGKEYWPIGDGQVQEINQTFEVPWAFIENDSFNFTIQIVRKGTKILPCKFEVLQLSEFNRSYICRLDTNWQIAHKTPEEELDKEAVQIRIFTDRNSPRRDIPKDAIALK